MQPNQQVPMARPAGAGDDSSGPLTDDQESYTIRRQVFKIFGAAFHVVDSAGNLVAYSKQKAFKLREDIRVYTDESMQQEMLTIQARQIIDFGASYDVRDPTAGNTPLGSLRRKGFTSEFWRDSWLIFSPEGQQIGMIQEESGVLAFLRRYIDFMAMLVPQKFHVLVGSTPVAHMRTHFSPFVYRLSVGFVPNLGRYISPRLVLASAILIAAIEGRQG